MGAAASQSDPKPAKVKVVLTVPSQGTERFEKVSVDEETAERLIANNQAREA